MLSQEEFAVAERRYFPRVVACTVQCLARCPTQPRVYDHTVQYVAAVSAPSNENCNTVPLIQDPQSHKMRELPFTTLLLEG